MKYKVGDKVRVRKDLVANYKYGYDYFDEKMAPFVGKVVTISEVVDGEYEILEDGICLWTEEMFEGLANDAIKPNYYQFHGYDVFDIAEYFGLDIPLGNALKYLLRCKHKENEEQDLRKAIKCIERHLEMMKRDNQKLASDTQNVGD